MFLYQKGFISELNIYAWLANGRCLFLSLFCEVINIFIFLLSLYYTLENNRQQQNKKNKNSNCKNRLKIIIKCLWQQIFDVQIRVKHCKLSECWNWKDYKLCQARN